MIKVDESLRSARMLAAGRLTVTFRSLKTGSHITLTAKCRAPGEKGKWGQARLADAKVIFIEVPNSGGWNDKVGKITSRGFVADPSADPARVFCAKQLIHFVAGEPLPAGLEAFEEERCGKCGKELTDPVSIERGIGPTCLEAETGSKHQTKVKPTARVSGQSGSVLATTPELPADPGRRTEIATGKVDKQGVPMGYGDWRARAKVRKAVLQDDAPVHVYPAYCDQMTTLPGTTWEDIFRPAAEGKGIDLP